MSDKRIEFAKALRESNKDDAQRITAHFVAQKDLFTECQLCHETVRGTIDQIKAHRCFSDLLG